jgi:hypothetical protein
MSSTLLSSGIKDSDARLAAAYENILEKVEVGVLSESDLAGLLPDRSPSVHPSGRPARTHSTPPADLSVSGFTPSPRKGPSGLEILAWSSKTDSQSAPNKSSRKDRKCLFHKRL